MRGRKRTINIDLCHVERSISPRCATTLFLYDSVDYNRKQDPLIVLNDLPPYMVSYLAQQCVAALRTIEKRIGQELVAVKEAGQE